MKEKKWIKVQSDTCLLFEHYVCFVIGSFVVRSLLCFVADRSGTILAHQSRTKMSYCDHSPTVARLSVHPHLWTIRLWNPGAIFHVKTLKSSPEPRKLWGWVLVYSIGDSRSSKFVQIMTLGWPLNFLQQGQICVPIHCTGKILKNYFLKMYKRLMAEIYNVWLK